MDEKKLFIVALHVYSLEQAMSEANKILAPGGAHGIIVVNNGYRVRSDSSPTLARIALTIKSRFPDKLVGINPLDLETADAITYTPTLLDMLWTDWGGIIENESVTVLDRNVEAALKSLVPQYWGSELFKVGEPPKNPEVVAKAAAKHFGALITSGTATGVAPEVSKIRQIREWIGPEARLGIASGMSNENARPFLDYADIFIVATSLCVGDGKGSNFWYYDQKKVRNFRVLIDEHPSKR